MDATWSEVEEELDAEVLLLSWITVRSEGNAAH